jgi:Tfp pilus assembly protein PilV
MRESFQNIVAAKTRGQSLLEVILALAIFSFSVAALASMVTGSVIGLTQGGEHVEASALAQEALEAVRAIRDRAWNEGRYNDSGVTISGNTWVLSGTAGPEVIGKFERIILFADVCRDGATHDSVPCPAISPDYLDVHSKYVTVTVSWQTGLGVTNMVEQSAYVTNWDSTDWVEDLFAEFDDVPAGNHTDTESTATFDDGEIVLVQQ